MPISHKLRALFIHIPKTGGSSIEKALGMIPPDDPRGTKPNFDYLYGTTGKGHLQHTPLVELVEQGHVGHEQLEYHKFAFVRNPWDRVVSEYFYRQSFGNWDGMDFTGFVRNYVPAQVERAQHFYPQSRFCDGLDFIGRFERLQRDFDRVCEWLDTATVRLPHVRKREHLFYPDYYTAETRAIVSRLYREDVERFAYTFESGRWCKRLAMRLPIAAKKLVRRLRQTRTKRQA